MSGGAVITAAPAVGAPARDQTPLVNTLTTFTLKLVCFVVAADPPQGEPASGRASIRRESRAAAPIGRSARSLAGSARRSFCVAAAWNVVEGRATLVCLPSCL